MELRSNYPTAANYVWWPQPFTGSSSLYNANITMKYEMAAALTLVASASAFVAPSLPVRGHVASSSATSLKMSSERSKALPMLPRPPAVRHFCQEIYTSQAKHDLVEEVVLLLLLRMIMALVLLVSRNKYVRTSLFY